jgi:UDP-N-acetylglucosamine--N-acetylmuramyl-(pentapeptide) pyrophosphoryl-undecaprenol N-acetylglucosamine transferase
MGEDGAEQERAAVMIGEPSPRPYPEGRGSSGAIVIAAGGTGGHFFPAEALGGELRARGRHVVLMTDARSGGERSLVFPEAHVLQGAGIVGRGFSRAARAAFALAAGTLQARAILATLRPGVVVGFGGYPSVPPVLATRLLRHRPRILLHEGNAILGQANRSLARFADHLALGMPTTSRLPPGKPTTVTGNPLRPGIVAQEYHPPEPGGPIRLLVTGGSLGARVLSTGLPPALARLPAAMRARLAVTQQCRAEDLDAVRAAYATAGIEAELSPFFADMPARLAAAHLFIGRAGASTVAELTAIGLPAILVPLPSVDGHQRHNAEAVGACVIEQPEFEHDPGAVAATLTDRLHADFLAAHAHAMAAHGIGDATRRLADLVEELAQKANA